ncbi:MAG: HAD hydrolase-like protein [Bacteroidales bacterium]|nr:HAD hydrolase-like protein [Bacteroidales bacterium]
MDYSAIRLLSFDCYGTLIDWKKSVLDILEPFFNDFQVTFSREELFAAFLEADRKIIAEDYLPYREILAEIVLRMADNLRISIDPASRYILSDQFEKWLPFSDTVESLKTLRKRYRLAIISNVDDELFAITNKILGIKFDFIVTAQQLGSYKPCLDNFRTAATRFGLEQDEILHVAQSIHHDIIPGNILAWKNVWVNRYAEPERTDPREFPDLEVPDMASLVKILDIESNASA